MRVVIVVFASNIEHPNLKSAIHGYELIIFAPFERVIIGFDKSFEDMVYVILY